MGTRLGAGLYEIVAQHLIAGDSRGIGLIQGLEIRPGIREGNVLRLAPPLSVSPAHVDEALHTLDDALTVARAYRPDTCWVHPEMRTSCGLLVDENVDAVADGPRLRKP
jgi:adenosylmethionine-8-amino-7-oxononanoate aminotransferase